MKGDKKKNKGNRDRKYRPKVVADEGEKKVTRRRKVKTSNHSAPPKPPNRGISGTDDTVVASLAASLDAYLGFGQLFGPSLNVSPTISMEAISYAYRRALGQRDANNYPIIVYQRRHKREQCGLQNIRKFKRDDEEDGNIRRRDGSRYSMLVYQRRLKLEGCDLLNSRKFGPDFPRMFKKKRTQRTSAIKDTKLHLPIDDIGRQGGQRTVVLKKLGEGPKKQMPKVDISHETEREEKLLMQIFHGGEGAEEERGGDRKKWWEEQRKQLHVRMATFLYVMHIIQGDRRFSEWKGSVVDSVVGVFLAQNVSDKLSSSAFMSLASRFPVKHTNEKSCCIKSIPIVKEVKAERGEFPRNNYPIQRESVFRAGRSNSDRNQGNATDWDELRKTYASGSEREISGRYSDSVDWEAVRMASPAEVADAIKMRGQNGVLGERIQDFLTKVVKDHGNIDLEWLRNVPPDQTKDYLMSFYGLGLKSVECVRLLCLHQKAFPVDVNVTRVAVRLGWVPLQPLPGGLELHLLDQYPMRDEIQAYLWSRLCTLDQKTLYELHCQIIAFGKVFCTKRNPSCGPCPLKAVCKHYASAVASTKLSLPRPEASAVVSILNVDDSTMINATATESIPSDKFKNVEPVIEYPPSPPRVCNENRIRDIEDWYGQIEDEDEDVEVDMDGDEDIPTIRIGIDENEDDTSILKLDTKELKNSFQEVMDECNIVLPEDDVSKALMSLTSAATSIPSPKLKNIGRLKTVHNVYELPDSHPVLAGVERREPDDPSPYLLVIWASDADAGRPKTFRNQSCSQNVDMSSSLDYMKAQSSETVPGTLMIPCRTANKGRFPLNGTYFQVNEVFADEESAEDPIQVPREWLWSLERRPLYCGHSASAIFTGCSIEDIRDCFWRGFICTRAFNRRTRAPVALPDKFHESASSKGKGKRKYTQGKGKRKYTRDE